MWRGVNVRLTALALIFGEPKPIREALGEQGLPRSVEYIFAPSHW